MLDNIRLTTQIRPDDVEKLLAESDASRVAETTNDTDAGPQARQTISCTVPFRPSARPASAQLLLYYDDQKHFDSFRLTRDRTVIGRSLGDVVVDFDPLMSSQHAEIIREKTADGWRWVLRDLNSTNGVFVCVDRARLKDGDQLLMGSERYRFYENDGRARLQHVLNHGDGEQIELPADGFCVGRDQHFLLNAFWDERLDPKHAFFQPDKTGAWSVKNLQSMNGIWYRITELALFRRCYFQVGEQRFGFRC